LAEFFKAYFLFYITDASVVYGSVSHHVYWGIKWCTCMVTC